MNPKERNELIEKLVECFMDTCKNDEGFLHSILKEGWKGFEEMGNNELLDCAKEYLP